MAKQENFHATNGQIATSWNGKTSIEGAEMFTLTFRAKEAGSISNWMKAGSAMTAAEAYSLDGDFMKVGLSFGGQLQASNFNLYQNTPNPFAKSTVIGFDLPEGGEATIIVSDLSGKVVKVINGDFSQGYNQVELKRGDLPAAGVYSYQLKSGANQAVKKMILID